MSYRRGKEETFPSLVHKGELEKRNETIREFPFSATTVPFCYFFHHQISSPPLSSDRPRSHDRWHRDQGWREGGDLIEKKPSFVSSRDGHLARTRDMGSPRRKGFFPPQFPIPLLSSCSFLLLFFLLAPFLISSSCA